MDIVDFKSSNEFFYDEKSGLKNNTVRNLDLEDQRFWNLMRQWRDKKYGAIRINHAELVRCDQDKAKTSTEDQMYSFMRQIRNIAIYQNLIIITWDVE